MRLYWGPATCNVILIFLSPCFSISLSFSFLPRSAELLNCPFFQAPQPQNLPRGKLRGHRRIWDDEREKTRDEQIAALNWLEENIVSLISPLLILNPNLGAINWRYNVLGGIKTRILPKEITGLRKKRVGFSIQTVVCPGTTLSWWKWMQF